MGEEISKDADRRKDMKIKCSFCEREALTVIRYSYCREHYIIYKAWQR